MRRKRSAKVRREFPLRNNMEVILKIDIHDLQQYSCLRHADLEATKNYRELYLG